jgi:hypothetical protein
LRRFFFEVPHSYVEGLAHSLDEMMARRTERPLFAEYHMVYGISNPNKVF